MDQSRIYVLCLLLQLSTATRPALAIDERQPPLPPNIVFILADDLGYGELGCYGQTKIRTPHIDRLASEGIRFTQHYSGAPVCAPARCVLMTGNHLAHAEIRGNRDSGNGRTFPGQWPLTAEALTIAEVLKQAGYKTGGFGKWGLGPTDTSGSPIRQGFDRFFGYNCQRNAHSYYPPYLDSDETTVAINEHPIPGHKRVAEGEIRAEDYVGQTYAPDRILAEAVAWLDENRTGPFFLYLPFVEPHVAMHPPQTWLEKYPEDWDREHGAYRGENGYLPHPRPRAAYAALISDLDEHVGTILSHLEKHGLTDNTIVVFTSDNGPTHRGPDKRWNIGGAACTFFDSTGGLRGYKGSCYEGGIRIPCIVRWPGHIAPNSVSATPSYFPDWFPTLASIAGAELPCEHSVDGTDLAPVFRGENLNRADPMVWEFYDYNGILAIRQGKWKAIRNGLLLKGGPKNWELYDLENDPGEKNNLAAQHPDIVSQLESSHSRTRISEHDFPIPLLDAG
jgi:arylsulfatase